MKKKTFQVSCIAIVVLCAAIVPFPYSVLAKSKIFGHVSVGETSKTTFGGMFVTNFTSPPDLGNITQITAYLATGGTSAKAVIYSDNQGMPNTLLAQSSDVEIEGTSGRWVDFNISYEGEPNATYWLGVLISSAGTYYYSSNVEGKAIYSAPATDATHTFTEATANPNEDLSVYAVYSPTASAAPQPENQVWIQTFLLAIFIAGLIVAVIVAILVYVKRRKS